MNRTLAVVGAAGLALAVPAAVTAKDPDVVRRMAWSGGPRVEFALPARVTLTQSPTVSMVVRGPKEVVDRVYLDGPAVRLRRLGGWRGWWGWSDRETRVAITVSGPAFNHIAAHSAADLEIVELRADRLELEVHSAARARARLTVAELDANVHSAAHLWAVGQADRVKLDVHSAADADLGGLVANHVQVNAHSAASAIVNPKLSADAEAHSAASVRLVGRPQTLRSTTHSAGSVTISAS